MMVNDQQGFIMRWFLVLQAAPDNYRKRLLTSGYCPGVIVHVHSQRCFAVKPIQGLHKDPVMVPKRLSHSCKSGRGEAQAGDGALIFQYASVCSLRDCRGWDWALFLQIRCFWKYNCVGRLGSCAGSFVTSALPLWQCWCLLRGCHGEEGPFSLGMLQGHSNSAALSAKNCCASKQ